MAYISSDQVKVYPSAYRGPNINTESRLNSEFNITKRINQTFRSFVIRPVTPFVKTDISDSNPDDSKYSLEFNLCGYWFYIKALGVKSIIPNDVSSIEAIWAHIKIWPLNGTDADYQAWSLYSLDTSKTTSILDVNSQFYGIEFLTGKLTGANPTTYEDSTNDKYLLVLVKGSDNKWSVPNSSLLALSAIQIEDSEYKGCNISEKLKSFYINNNTFDGVTINGTTGNITNINFENITDNLNNDSTKGTAELRKTKINVSELYIEDPSITIEKVEGTQKVLVESLSYDSTSSSYIKTIRTPINIGLNNEPKNITHYGDINLNNSSVVITKAVSGNPLVVGSIGLYNDTYIGSSIAPKNLTHYGDWNLYNLVKFTKSSTNTFSFGMGTSTTGVSATQYGSLTQYTNDSDAPVFKVSGNKIELGYQYASKPSGTAKTASIKLYTGEGTISADRMIQVFANSWDSNPYIKICRYVEGDTKYGKVYFGTSSSNTVNVDHYGNYNLAGNLTVNNIIPSANKTYNIGSDSDTDNLDKWYKNIYAEWLAGTSHKVDVYEDSSTELYLTASNQSGYDSTNKKSAYQSAFIRTTGLKVKANTLKSTSGAIVLNGAGGVNIQYNESNRFSIGEAGTSVTNYLKVSSYIESTGSYVKANSYMEAPYFQSTSDRRLKENIKDFSCSGSILNLPIKEFDYKKTGSHHIGCIAQDLQKICPEIVHEDSDGFLTIEESKIVYLLLDEVKKLSKKVEKLEKQLKSK